jgi:hypothetical protein
MQRIVRRRTVAVLGLAAGALFLTGCRGGPDGEWDAVKLRANLNPELYTLYERPSDVKNSFAVGFHEDVRMIRQDLHRAFYLDRQSRLTREPIPR